MHIEQIDRYCDLFEERLKRGEPLTAGQFLQEQRLPAERQLQAELEKLEREYLNGPSAVQSRSVHRMSRVLQARPIMASASIDELEQAILRAGLLSHQELSEALAQLPPDTREAGPETVAQEFVRRGRLTEFQKQMLLAGQSDGLVLGEYTLLSLLGAGGMGRVFRALHRRMAREVALKVLPERLVAQEDAVQRFEREVRVAARLVHPNVVTAYDAGEHQGMHYLVMEYVAGADLASVVKSLGPLSAGDALRCAIQAAAGLAYAHGQGVTHRDIKPGNLLLDAHGVVKLLDLGLARMRAELPGQSDSLSASGAVMGTVDFMPPEQALNAKSADERSDVYSLGCTLHFLLTGRPVFERDTIMEKLLAHREAPIPSLRERLPDVSPQLNAIVTRMLAKVPADRFATMTEVADALRQCLVATGEETDLAVRAAGRLGSVGVKAASAQETRDYMVERSVMSTQIAAAPTYVPAGSVVSVETAPPSSRRRRWLIGGLAALLLVAAGVVVYLKFADGALRVQVIAPDAELFVDGEQVATVTWGDRQKEYRISLDPGRHRIKVQTKGGDVFYSNDEVIVKAGRDTELFRAEWIDPSTSPAPQPPVVSVAEAIKDGVLTVAQDGSAEFTSLKAAVAAVKEGQTIRVLDDAEYAEPLTLNLPSQHKRITIEATRRATLVAPRAGAAVLILHVGGVALRGFRIRADQEGSHGVAMLGECSGCLVEDIEFRGSPTASRGVGLEALTIPPNAEPAVVRGCRFEDFNIGVRVSGLEDDYKTPMPCRAALIAENLFLGNMGGVALSGNVRDVLVVGNRFVGCAMAGVQFENLIADDAGQPPGRLLMANNTFLDCTGSLKVWDDDIRGESISVRSNLVLSPVGGVDWLFFDSGDNPVAYRGAGQGQKVIDRWTVAGNWRETVPPAGASLPERAWIPGPSDELHKEVAVASRQLNDSAFLQPLAESELATAGAGESEGLPPYVGAVPPPGMEKWDWNKTWEAWTKTDPAEDGVLTVAQDGSAEFMSLKAALAAARPGMTIRVVDDGEYAEVLDFVNSRKHENITLEATRGATLLTSLGTRAIGIINVRDITIRGFDVRAAGAPAWGVIIAGNSPGCLIEDVVFSGSTNVTNRVVGISLEGLSGAPMSEPVTVRGCRFESLPAGVRVSGVHDNYKSPYSCRGVLIVDNLFRETRQSVVIVGAVRDTVVAGNKFLASIMHGTQVENLLVDSAGRTPGRILIANNSFLDCVGSFRVWDDDIVGERIAVRSNMILSPAGPDCFFLDSGDSVSIPRAPGDGKKVTERWSFAGNWRETEPPQGESLREQSWIPAGTNDVLQTEILVASRDEANLGFLQPAADSPLATAGAGESEGLPAWVGAVAPPGAPKWDWKETWRKWTDPAADGVLAVAQDGTGEFTSLKAALDAARPGATIRIIDAAEYEEPLLLRDPARHENVTIESTRRATLIAPQRGIAVNIIDVGGVMLKGFDVRLPGEPVIGINLVGDCRGCVVEDVQFGGGTGQPITKIGVNLEGLTVPPSAVPVTVRRCRFESLSTGVLVNGLQQETRTPIPCRGALIADNDFVGNVGGVHLYGAVRDAVVVGNRFIGATMNGIQFARLLADAAGQQPGRLLVANNTFLDCAGSLILWDDVVRGEDVAVRNNLVLSPVGVDWMFIETDDPSVPKGPGDGKKVNERWSFSQNWREMTPPQGNSLREQAWIPRAEQDVLQEQIAVGSRDEADPAFLQPAADSPLATGGSGESAGLPSYVGAVAPAGGTAWDWNATWQVWLKDE